jgi:hypothetical protein
MLTEKEFTLLDIFAHCEMNSTNGATPTSTRDVHTYLWPDERAEAMGVSEQAVGGILASLLDKKFCQIVSVADSPKVEGDTDGRFWFTEAGFTAWRAERTARGLADKS